MGSYISIYNNTRDTYHVKVGSDEAALEIAKWASTALAIAATTVATLGAAAPLAAALVANGVVEVMFLSTSALAAVTSAAAAASGISIPATLYGWSMSAAFFLSQSLKDEGYVEIPAGETRQFGKYTLSLWQQAACRRVRINPEKEGEVLTDVVYMRPIFSGATDGSTLEHNIQYWIDKHGHEEQQVLRANLTG